MEPALLSPGEGLGTGMNWSPETHVVVSTLRALVRAESRSEAASLLQTAVTQLGGGIIPAREATGSDLPVDVSLGVGVPLVVRPPDDSAAALFLTSHIASIVEDAVSAARRSDRYQRETVRATIDILTKVSSRAEIGARLGSSVPGDVVCLLDLDNFKVLNDTRGHAAGDAALSQFGALLLASIRDDDFVGRSGGDEFVVVLRGAPMDVAYRRLRLLANKWRISGHLSTSVSVGIAAVDPRGGAVANRAADRAMYRAKRSGRGLVEMAQPDDYTEVES